MNSIDFKLHYFYPKSFSNRPYVEVFVDGTSLQEIFDFRFGGGKQLSYGLICLPRLAPPKHYFRGYRSRYDESRGRKQVLDCSCGSPGCDPVFCRIALDDDLVKWHDFVGAWSKTYDIDDFVFDGMQYLQALDECQYMYEKIVASFGLKL